jgi:hypothetical protein
MAISAADPALAGSSSAAASDWRLLQHEDHAPAVSGSLEHLIDHIDAPRRILEQLGQLGDLRRGQIPFHPDEYAGPTGSPRATPDGDLPVTEGGNSAGKERLGWRPLLGGWLRRSSSQPMVVTTSAHR